MASVHAAQANQRMPGNEAPKDMTRCARGSSHDHCCQLLLVTVILEERGGEPLAKGPKAEAKKAANDLSCSRCASSSGALQVEIVA